MQVSASNLHILLAEDNPINQRLATVLLEKKGWRVTAVPNGAAALRAFVPERFDVILMDVQMPELDGLEATRRLRQKEAAGARRVPVIGLTAHAMQGDREKCLEAGMDDYVAKPIRPEILYLAIERCLRGESATVQESTAVDITDALAAVDGDRKFLRELADQLINDFPWQVTELRNALAERDAKKLERLAHSLKSVVGIFGARLAVELSQELEWLGEREKLEEAPKVLQKLEQELEKVKSALVQM